MYVKNKLKRQQKMAYGLGSLGESLSYNVFYSFFIYFITTYAGVKPAIAGTISFIAVAWDAITDPLIGHFSDYCKSPKGKRIPFIMFSSIPLGITVFALFTNPQFSALGKSLYYLLVNILFWLFFTGADVPYIAFGAELTNDYDERTQIRTWAQIFTGIGNIIIGAAALPIVDKITLWTGNEVKAWTYFGAAIGIISGIAFFVTALLLQKDDTILEAEVQVPSFTGVVHEYIEILKLKEYRKVILISLILNCILGIGSSSNLFLWKYVFEFQTSQIATLGLISTIFSMLAAFPAQWISLHLGKKQSMIVSFIAIATGLAWLYFMPHIFINAVIGQIFKLGGMGMFWTVIFALNYDIVEIDELKNEKRRDGLLISLNSFFMKIGVSFGMWFAGLTLGFFRIDPSLAAQTEAAANNLKIATIIPQFILCLIAIFTTFTYKVTKEKFVKVKEALNKRKNGEEIAMKEFEDLL